MRNPHAGSGAGTSDQLARRDEVSTREDPSIQLRHEVDTWAPWSTEAERAQRLRLYKSRDICGAHAARAAGWTHHVFKTAEEIAGEWIWRRASDDELRRVANAVGRMIQAGAELEQGSFRDA